MMSHAIMKGISKNSNAGATQPDFSLAFIDVRVDNIFAATKWLLFARQNTVRNDLKRALMTCSCHKIDILMAFLRKRSGKASAFKIEIHFPA